MTRDYLTEKTPLKIVDGETYQSENREYHTVRYDIARDLFISDLGFTYNADGREVLGGLIRTESKRHLCIRPMKSTEGRKDDGGKLPYDLIAPEFLAETARALQYGSIKYEPHNWARGMAWSRCFSALMRHLWAWWGGEQKDPETGFTHLSHACACLMFLVAYEARGTGTDDRWKEPTR